MKFKFWWHFDISVLATSQFWWHFSFGDISALVKFQSWWRFSFGDISVLATFQFWWHFSFGDISVLVWSGLDWSGLVTWESSKARVTLVSAQRCEQADKQTTNNVNIEPTQTCQHWLELGNLEIGNLNSAHSDIISVSCLRDNLGYSCGVELFVCFQAYHRGLDTKMLKNFPSFEDFGNLVWKLSNRTDVVSRNVPWYFFFSFHLTF